MEELTIIYENKDGELVERKFDEIDEFIELMNEGTDDMIYDIADGTDIIVVIDGNTSKRKHFSSLDGVLDYCKEI